MAHEIVDPVEAVRRVGARFRARRGEVAPVEASLGRYLAAPVALPPGRGTSRRAAVNGYALPRGAGAGEYPLRGEAAGPAPETAAAAGIVRVETGELLPPGTDRVVPAEWTTISASSGSAPLVRIEGDAVPPEGYGITPPDEPAAAGAGTRVDPRLLALLHDRGVGRLETFPPRRVATFTIGLDLADLHGGQGPDSVRDLTGFWLPLAVRALGHFPQPLGICGDELAEVRAVLLRAQKRKLGLVIAAGGTGDGVGDRTVELLHRIGARIRFERVAVRPGRSCVLAEWMDLQVLALPGGPLEAAAGFDLLAAPALRAAAGAPREEWDWSLRRVPVAELPEVPGVVPPPPDRERRDGRSSVPLWRALPVRQNPSGLGWKAAGGALPHAASSPWIAGQTAWALFPPVERDPPQGGGEPERMAGGFHLIPNLTIALTRPDPLDRI